MRAVVAAFNQISPVIIQLQASRSFVCIPDFTPYLQVEEALYSLEDNWTDIVESHAQLSERLKAQQTALWELISTELAYIRTLKVIQDVSVSSPFTITGSNCIA